MTDEELQEVVQHPDGWAPYNYKLALQILSGRNGSSLEEEEQLALKDLPSDKESPKDTRDRSSLWIILGYSGVVFSILQLIFFPDREGPVLPQLGFYRLPAITPKLLCLLLGYILYASKMAPGFYRYSNNVRMHGLIILILTAALLCIKLVMGYF